MALGKLLLQETGAFLLSEKFSQDPLEEYFSKQRGLCGRNDNPTVREFQQNMLRLQVAGSPTILASVRGNCTVNNQTVHNICARPMPRREKK